MIPADRLRAALADRYEIEREIGVGGLATVYLARDLRHQRLVALKLLSLELGAVLGPERFLSEIRVTANLQHPNLLPLFDSGEADGQLYYVMPFIEGESLRTRLERERQLPVREAVRIAAAIAGALDYAHRQGVIHRDLKPENILLHEGQPLVADFGIALAVSRAGGARVTQTGLSLGTPQYMSPEQATGERTIDARSDIYSLGAVLYEMLAGEPPHTGATVQAVIARVVTEAPRSIRAARPAVPEHVDVAVQKALQKVPADRFETAREFAEVLEGERPITAAALAQNAGVGTRAVTMSRKRYRDPVVIALAVATVALGALTAMKSMRAGAAPEGRVVRFAINLPVAERVSNTGPGLAISPDGRTIAYTGQSAQTSALYVRNLDELRARLLPGTEGGSEPFFSPDGKWLAFRGQAGVLQKVPVEGGSVVTLGAVSGLWGGAWGADKIVFGAGRALYTVSPAGGTAAPLTHDKREGESGFGLPVIAPDGKSVLFTISIDSTGPGVNQLASASLSDGTVTRLGIEGANVLGFAGGNLVYGKADGTVWGVAFDYRRGRRLAAPVPLLENVTFGESRPLARLSEEGTLIYQQGTRANNVVAVDRHGMSTVLLGDARDYRFPRLSPDGRRIALQITAQSAADIWVYDRVTQVLSRVTSSGDGLRPEWTPDGTRIVYVCPANNGVCRVAPDGSAAPEQLYRFAFGGIAIWEIVVGPDASSAVIRSDSASGNKGLWELPLRGDRTPRVLVQGPGWRIEPRISPDGQWVAYVSDESGALQVYVRPLSAEGGRVQVSPSGGSQPVWSRSGRSLYYRTAGALMEAVVDTRSGFSVVRQTKLFEENYVRTPATHAEYDVAADDRSFLMLKPAGDVSDLIVVLNWTRELRARMSATGK